MKKIYGLLPAGVVKRVRFGRAELARAAPHGPRTQEAALHVCSRFSLSALLPAQIRNVLEFDGGVADTHVSRASPNAPLWSGLDYVYRPPPA